MSGMPDSQAGVAASVASASRQAGSALGVAITGSLIAERPTRACGGQPRRVGRCSRPAGWASSYGSASTGPRALATAQRVRETLAAKLVRSGGPQVRRAGGSGGSGTGRRSLMARLSKAA